MLLWPDCFNICYGFSAFAVHLCEIILDPSHDFASRQLGSVLLKQYVEFHWSKESDKFTPPECPSETKERVRQMLPLGLKVHIFKHVHALCTIDLNVP